jgi:uncharacterized metal-binding protein YceD (DUF177 family)
MTPPPTPHDRSGPRLRLAELPRNGPQAVDLVLSQEESDAIADRLVLRGLRKPSFAGTLTPVGKQDWNLDATLAATVVQPCVRTLAPVTTRVTDTVTRRYRAEIDPEPQAEEMEMPEDDTQEPLPAVLDLAAVFEEALALALPLYPSVEDSAAADRQFGPPGVTPLTDADLKPLSGLAALKRRMDGDGEDTEDGGTGER